MSQGNQQESWHQRHNLTPNESALILALVAENGFLKGSYAHIGRLLNHMDWRVVKNTLEALDAKSLVAVHQASRGNIVIRLQWEVLNKIG